nr:chitinase-like protein 2 [Oryza sativa Japonica Group]
MGIACVQVGLATGGLTAWGSPTIRDEPPGGLLRQDKLTIPRVKGAECYGRGAIPVIWNCNYGDAGNKKADRWAYIARFILEWSA